MIKDYYYTSELNKLVNRISMDKTAPNVLFNGISDDYWFWLNTVGYTKSLAVRQVLVDMPDKTTQLTFTGSAGDATLRQGFLAYKLFKQIFESNVGNLSLSRNVLDFGCGWGRIIRFFLKDIEPSKLWGIDAIGDVIEVCRQTNKWCNLKLISPMPPTSFSQNMFDLIYCYSVFSHLSEDCHKKWLLEFKRILSPGGLLIATTRRREFIEACVEMRKEKHLPEWKRSGALSFVNASLHLSNYDSGH